MIPNLRIDLGRGSKRFTINWRIIGNIRNGVGNHALQEMTRHRPCCPIPNSFDIFGPSSENLKKIHLKYRSLYTLLDSSLGNLYTVNSKQL